MSKKINILKNIFTLNLFIFFLLFFFSNQKISAEAAYKVIVNIPNTEINS